MQRKNEQYRLLHKAKRLNFAKGKDAVNCVTNKFKKSKKHHCKNVTRTRKEGKKAFENKNSLKYDASLYSKHRRIRRQTNIVKVMFKIKICIFFKFPIFLTLIVRNKSSMVMFLTHWLCARSIMFVRQLKVFSWQSVKLWFMIHKIFHKSKIIVKIIELQWNYKSEKN